MTNTFSKTPDVIADAVKGMMTSDKYCKALAFIRELASDNPELYSKAMRDTIESAQQLLEELEGE